MDQDSVFESAYQRSQNDRPVSCSTFGAPLGGMGMFPGTAQEFDTSLYGSQPTENSYPQYYDPPSYPPLICNGITDSGWSGDSASTAGNDSANTPTAQTSGWGFDYMYQPAQPAYSAPSNPDSQTAENKPLHERTGTSQVTAPKKEQFVCLEPGCKQKPFGRAADLDRHHKMLHQPAERIQFHCDYRRCARAEDGAPFYRQDHFRDHFRDYHKEDIFRRGLDIDNKWWNTRKLHSSWWRCSKCLQRVAVASEGWVCPNCRSECELKRRQKRSAVNLEA